MATITNRPNKDGSTSYRVSIRKKNIEFFKTFFTEEDAKLYEFYKERLIDNMENFEVKLEDRITFTQIMELKLNAFPEYEKRNVGDFTVSFRRFEDAFGTPRFYGSITYDEWMETAKKFLNMDVFRGAKTESGKRKMSINTLRKMFAHASSAISYAQSQGLNLENHPLKVIQVYIMPMLDRQRNKPDNISQMEE